MPTDLFSSLSFWQWTLFVVGPTVVVLGIFMYGFVKGWWRTKQELETERERRRRAEDQVDKLVPAVNHLTDAVREMNAGWQGYIASRAAKGVS